MKYTIKTINNNSVNCLNPTENKAITKELSGLVSYICSSLESISTDSKNYKNQLQHLKSSSKCFQTSGNKAISENCLTIKTNLESAINNAELLDKLVDDNNYNITYTRELHNKIMNSTIELVNLIRKDEDGVNKSFINDHKYSYLFMAVATCSIFVTYIVSPAWTITSFLGSLATSPLIKHIDDTINNHAAMIANVDEGYLKADRLLGVLEDNLETLFKDHDNSNHLIGVAQNSSE